MSDRVAGLVLAAGGSTRMGRPKQLAELAGRPMLEYPLMAMAAAPVGRVIVALGAHACRIKARVDLHGAEVFVAPGWREGMGTVLAEAAGAYGGGCDALVVALGDQPLLTAATVAGLVAAWEAGAGPVVRAAYAGRPGHPVLFAGEVLAELPRLRGDKGARELLGRMPDRVHLVELGHTGDDMDVDDERGLARARELLRAREAAGLATPRVPDRDGPAAPRVAAGGGPDRPGPGATNPRSRPARAAEDPCAHRGLGAAGARAPREDGAHG